MMQLVSKKKQADAASIRVKINVKKRLNNTKYWTNKVNSATLFSAEMVFVWRKIIAICKLENFPLEKM